MPGSHESNSQKALIPGTVPVLQLPVREFFLGETVATAISKGYSRKYGLAGVFRGIPGHLGDPLSWEDRPVCPFRVKGLMLRTVCLLYLLHVLDGKH